MEKGRRKKIGGKNGSKERIKNLDQLER